MTKFSSIEKFFIALTIMGGSLILFFPVQYLLIAFIGVIVLVYLLANPKICYYLVIISSTYLPPFATESQQMPFNQTDLIITLCFVSCLFQFISVNKFRSINLSTKIDKWFVVLLILYFFAGITSASHRGYQGFLHFGEVVALFYVTVYFIRTKQITISKIIKILLTIGLFQALYGTLQSLTGGFGANFQDNRGFLGYLGLGSSLVWHGMGSLGHFNCLGALLSSLLLFFIPIYHFVVKNKKKGKIIIAILLVGIITTYSRNALICLTIGMLFFAYCQTQNKVKFSLILATISSLIYGAYNFLKNTSYGSTICPRNEVWDYSFDVITSSAHNLLLGTGLKSFSEVVAVYMANSFVYLHAHNLYVATLLEMGIIGLTLLVAFFLYSLVYAYKNTNAKNKFFRVLNLSLCLYIIAILALGVFDDTFGYFYTQIWLYIILGFLYAKHPKLYTKNI